MAPDGTAVVTGNADGLVTIWDDAEARVDEFRATVGRSPITDVSFDRRGQRLLAGCASGEYRVRDVGKNTLCSFRVRREAGYPAGAVLSPDSRTVIVWNAGSLGFYDAASSEKVYITDFGFNQRSAGSQ